MKEQTQLLKKVILDTYNDSFLYNYISERRYATD